MILSSKAIEANIEAGRITIDPYNPAQLNPNSYNLRLADELLVYKSPILDMAREEQVERIEIPPEGLILLPGELYLGRTMEFTNTRDFVPMLEGRSSVGRLGMFVHVSAGFGDVGFAGYWTLEIMVAKPLRVYAGTEICQIFYNTIAGDVGIRYSRGKYANAPGIQPSMLWKEFQKEEQK